MNPVASGADPWVITHEGKYFWCESIRGNRAIALYESSDLVTRDLTRVVWAPEAGPFSKQLWAPELHRVDGRWYIYVAASHGQNRGHRMIVLEGTTESPLDDFRLKSVLYTGDDVATGCDNRWAIDGTILEHEDARYFLWSGWHDRRDEQWLYIARMENPWTIAANRTRLCANDDHLWERVDEALTGRGLNEAPQILKRNGRLFIVFSASGSWQCSYKLGRLDLVPGGNVLNPEHWRKHPAPVFQSNEHAWGVGHCSFTRSPDGTQDWMTYHAKTDRRVGWRRAVHVQEFSWTTDGEPHFGVPTEPGRTLPLPSGCRRVHQQQSFAFSSVSA